MAEFSLTLSEILALGGLVQCVFVIVYILFRAGFLVLARPPLLFFIVLAFAFYMDLAAGTLFADLSYYNGLHFWGWVALLPVSILFIFQFSRLIEPVTLRYYAILLLVPAGILLSSFTTSLLEDHSSDMSEVSLFWGLIVGTLSLPFLWLRETVLDHVPKEPAGRDRYWMIVALLGMNIAMLGTMLAAMTAQLSFESFETIRTIIGVAIVYISSTSLFRIYPPPIRAIIEGDEAPIFTDTDRAHLAQIDRLLMYEKVYLEPGYGRSDLARELELPESLVSRLINEHYRKSFPVLLNDLRVGEAKQLLKQTDAPVKVIAEETGFNSLATFNRVFKELTGVPASKFRESKTKT